MAVEEKWKANLEKVAFMKQFPGLLGSWESLAGKTVTAVIPLKGSREPQYWCAPMRLYYPASDGVGALRVGRSLGRGTGAP